MAKEIYLQFTMEDGTVYTVNDPKYAYCYKQDAEGFKKRVSKTAIDNAYEEYKDSEWGKQELEAKKQAQEEQEKSDKAAEKKVNKPRKSKDIAYEGCGITLTSKQVTFIKGMQEDDFYEHGLDSALWVDVFCDTMSGMYNRIVMGALLSTLKEKEIVTVGKERVNGKISTFFAFTDLGKQVAKELGLK